MSEPLIQVDIEREIMRLSERAEQVTSSLAKRARAAAEADVAYKVCHAQAYLLSEGTVGERDATATVKCKNEYREKRATEALLLSAQEAGRNYRAQLDSLRSINANLRALVVGG